MQTIVHRFQADLNGSEKRFLKTIIFKFSVRCAQTLKVWFKKHKILYWCTKNLKLKFPKLFAAGVIFLLIG